MEDPNDEVIQYVEDNDAASYHVDSIRFTTFSKVTLKLIQSNIRRGKFYTSISSLIQSTILASV